MKQVRNIAIAGLGLIGGSIARDCAARGMRVIGYDRNPDAVRAAIDEGVIGAELEAGFEALHDVDVFIVATPVNAAAAILAGAAPRIGPETIITDACSTKRTIEHAAVDLGLGARFVGGHPLAGDVRSGWSASRAGLFHQAPVYLCPTEHTGDRALQIVREIWTAAGAIPEVMSAVEHDRLVAATSHLPQVIATSLARVLADAGIPLSRLGPGGRDMTRLAHSSPEVWTAIALDNADALLPAVLNLERELAGLRLAIETGDEAAVRGFFTGAVVAARV